MKTALIFAYECAPFNRAGSTIGAQRPYQMAKYLSKSGWRTIVLTCDFNKRRSIETVDKNSIKELVDQGILELKKNGWAIVGLPSLKHDGWIDRFWWKFTHENPVNGTLKPNTNFFSSMLRKLLTLVKLTQGDHSQSWQPVAQMASSILANRVAPQVVIAEHGPDAGLFLGKWYHKKFGIPWVTDFRDPVDRGIPFSIRKIYVGFIKRLIKSASFSIAVTPYWTKLDSNRLEKRSHFIPNGYDPEEYSNSTASSSIDSKILKIAYLGAVQQTQNIDIFLQGLSNLNIPSKEKYIKFVYRGYAYDKVLKIVKSLGILNIVDIGHQIERQESLNLLQSADVVLLLSIDATLNNDPLLKYGVYPGKVFEYFGAGKPIILTPSDGGELDDILNSTKSGWICSTPEQVAGILKELYVKWSKNKPLINPQINLTSKYSRKNQMKLLASYLDEII